ncbi:hypothetical protein A2U01_0078503, partial [Trifolium medium]|nr:hypothetical protein [Trifolium medium]
MICIWRNAQFIAAGRFSFLPLAQRASLCCATRSVIPFSAFSSGVGATREPVMRNAQGV